MNCFSRPYMASEVNKAAKHKCSNLPRTSDSLNEGGQIDVIVMDFSKAFDKVDLTSKASTLTLSTRRNQTIYHLDQLLSFI